VEYDEFIDRVAERAGVRREHAASLAQATLRVLADRISGGQDVDLAAQLPEQLARPLRKAPQKLPEKYGFAQFVERVRARAANVPGEEVLPGVRAVLLTLRDGVSDKEFRDTLDQLPHQFRELLQEEGAPEAADGTADAESGGDRTAGAAAPRGQRSGAPGPGAPQDDALVQRTAQRAGVPAQDAAELTRATLEVLGDLLGGGQAHDLATRLPDTSGEWLDEPVDTPAHDYGVESFVSRIRDRATGVLDDDVVPGIQAVMVTLRETVGAAELEIALRPLPGEYDELLVRIG
jgi:uncharacterized protein (DUF2267 family)